MTPSMIDNFICGLGSSPKSQEIHKQVRKEFMLSGRLEAMSIYQEKGFEDREEYLEYLSDEYEVELSSILAIAELLGREEDFDGLVSMIQDMAY